MDMFDDLDPWERIMLLQTRVEQLESINNEIVKHLQLTSQHVDSISKAVNQLQRDQVDLIREQYKSKQYEDTTWQNQQ